MRTLLRSALPANVDLQLDAAPGLPAILADAQVLERIVFDLATHAVEAMGSAGRFTITARTWRVEQPGSPPVPTATVGEYVWLTVADNGPGIDPARRATLFDPFYSATSKAVGAGLELAAVQGGVRQLRGFIDVDSQPGRGSVYSILLPLAPVEAVDAVREPPPRLPARILIVEDEPAVRQLAALILERAGLIVDSVGNVEDAIDRMEAAQPGYDLLVTDVVMPVMDGVSLYQTLVARHPRLRVLYMSGYGRDNLPGQVHADALTAFLQKPFTVETLTARVRELLDGVPASVAS